MKGLKNLLPHSRWIGTMVQTEGWCDSLQRAVGPLFIDQQAISELHSRQK